MKIFNKIKHFQIIIVLVFCFGVLFVFSSQASAQSISLISQSSTCKIGDNIFIIMSLNTANNSVNAIEGVVNVPVGFFDILEVRTGGSFLSLWPERPKVHKDGKITFLGGVPRGFSGSNGNIITFILRAKKAGAPSVFIEKATVLLNDGLGTELKGIELKPLTVLISEDVFEEPEDSRIIIDNTPPEPFTPVLSRDPSVAGGKYFVSFSAIDKDSGISHYEAREEYVIFPYFGAWFFTNWEKTETPYILKLQDWWSRIYIRAYDLYGNYREEIVFKHLNKETVPVFRILIALFMSIVALIMIVLFVLQLLNRLNKKTKQKNEQSPDKF